MITRHMRTHVRPDGSPIPFNELLIPPIDDLSLNQPPTPEPTAELELMETSEEATDEQQPKSMHDDKTPPTSNNNSTGNVAAVTTTPATSSLTSGASDDSESLSPAILRRHAVSAAASSRSVTNPIDSVTRPSMIGGTNNRSMLNIPICLASAATTASNSDGGNLG